MTLILREPKRKHRKNAAESLPFPIRTERATGIPVRESTWHTYTGRFNGDSVIVEDIEDIYAIYTMGYYGKGSLSRGCAVLGRYKSQRPTFINESQWRRHQQWMQMDSCNEGLDKGTTELKTKVDDNQVNKTNSDKTDNGIKENSKVGNKTVEHNITDLVDSDSECSDIMEVDTSDGIQNKKRKSETGSPRQQHKVRNPAAVEVLRVAHDQVAEETRAVEKSAVEEMGLVRKLTDEKKSEIRNSVGEKTVNAKLIEETNAIRKTVCNERVEQPPIVVVDLSSDEENSQSEPIEERDCSAVGMSKAGCSSYVAKSCEKAEVVVLTGVDSDDEDYLTKLKPRLEHEPAGLFQEKLILSLEEAMFLSYALGCLRILGLTGEELSLSEIWKLFQESQKTFVQRYVAYHYFRAKGWVVKSALKFGCDFALYKEGPHLYHSSYIVTVQVIDEGTSSRYAAHDRRPMNWTQVMAITRLAESAGKETMLCQVIWPTNLTEKILPSPHVISSFKIQEVLIRRWVASQDRVTDPVKRQDDDENSMQSPCT